MDGLNALVRAIVIVFALIACGLLITGAKSMEAAPENGRGLYVQSKDLHCFPVASLKVSFATVFPNAEQIVIEGPAAKAYLAEYNSFGKLTGFCRRDPVPQHHARRHHHAHPNYGRPRLPPHDRRPETAPGHHGQGRTRLVVKE